MEELKSDIDQYVALRFSFPFLRQVEGPVGLHCRYCFGGGAVVEFARQWPDTPGLRGAYLVSAPLLSDCQQTVHKSSGCYTIPVAHMHRTDAYLLSDCQQTSYQSICH